jgi:hypothetical protein
MTQSTACDVKHRAVVSLNRAISQILLHPVRCRGNHCSVLLRSKLSASPSRYCGVIPPNGLGEKLVSADRLLGYCYHVSAQP